MSLKDTVTTISWSTSVHAEAKLPVRTLCGIDIPFEKPHERSIYGFATCKRCLGILKRQSQEKSK